MEAETKQIVFCSAAYATQKAISLVLMSILPLAVLEAGGTHAQSVYVIGVYQIGISVTSYFSRDIFLYLERRGGYLLSILFFTVGTTLGLVGLLVHSAETLIASLIVVGSAVGLSGTVRFAAMEVSKPDKRSKDQALTMVLTGGIFAAAFGPLTVPALTNLIPGHPYVGCYILIFSLIAINLWLVSTKIKFPALSSTTSMSESRKGMDGVQEKQNEPSEKATLQFVLAAASSLWVNLYLMLVMSSILTEMVMDRDFSLIRSSFPITACFLGRFVPGFFSGTVLKDYGVYVGQVLACICLTIATLVFIFGDLDLASFTIGMTFTGLGWHAGFASGNVLLRRIKPRGNEQEQKRKALHYQALHDSAVFFMSGLIVLLASIANPRWRAILLIVSGVTGLLIITSAVSYYLGFTHRETETETESTIAQSELSATVVMNPIATKDSFSDTSGRPPIQLEDL